jgi:hypothetical protein
MVLVLVSGDQEKEWVDCEARAAWKTGRMTVAHAVGGFTGHYETRVTYMRYGHPGVGYIIENEGCGRKWDVIEK